MAVLPNLTQENEAQAKRIAELEAQLALASRPKALTMKVSEKGAISLYGLGRFPITLYSGQMTRLLEHATAIRAFMVTNKTVLATKD